MSSRSSRKETPASLKKPPNQGNTKEKKNDLPGRRIDRLIFVFILVAGLSTVYFVRRWTSPPPMPEYDMNEYWGTYPMDPKPDLSIKPYQIEFSDHIINDLRERLLHRRPLPQPLENSGFTYGFNSDFLSQVVDYWANSYKFKERERFLNQYNHYKTKVNGLDVHFMHVKPPMEEGIEYNTVPILLLHGWPGSIREFYELIPKLTKPSSKNFVFEVVVPSLPGFGFSEAPTRPGFGPMEMAIVIHNLMERLGLPQYYVQGGDLGHTVGSILATMFPENVLGFHTNLPTVTFNPIAHVYNLIGSWFPWWIEEPKLLNRLYPYTERLAATIEEMGYLHLQTTKPDTIGAALSDSPSGLAAYILEKFSTWTDPNNKLARDGNLLDKFSLTQLLDNVMIYWVTNSITTSVRIYAETVNRRMIPVIFDSIPTEVPTWGIKFRHEIIHHSDKMLRLKYKNYLQSSIVDNGGHFAAFENPDLLAYDIYTAVQAFKKFHGQENPAPITTTSVYDFTVNNIHGKPVSLETYRGYMLLIVNVASKSVHADHAYKELTDLYEKYYTRGLRILVFPSNTFRKEPLNSIDFIKYAKQKGLQFDLFEKVNVNGENETPLWKFLKEEVRGGALGEDTLSDFEKFLVDKEGGVGVRFGAQIGAREIESFLQTML